MTVWIAPVLSILALLVSIIAQREKLLSFFDELKKRIAESNERRRALAIVGKFADPNSKQQPSLLSFYIPVFLISIISSAVLSYLGRQPQFYNTILLSASIYLFISMIVLVTFLVTSRRFEFSFIVALLIAVLMVSALWGIFVLVIDLLRLGALWTGILAGIAVILFLLDADRRASRQARKRRIK